MQFNFTRSIASASAQPRCFTSATTMQYLILFVTNFNYVRNVTSNFEVFLLTVFCHTFPSFEAKKKGKKEIAKVSEIKVKMKIENKSFYIFHYSF